MASISGANGVVFTTTNSQTASTVQSAFAAASTQYVSGGGTVSGQFVADNTSGQTYVGSGTSVTGFLPDNASANSSVSEAPAVYETGTASSSTIYASDLSNATLINNNPTGSLTGIFGAGGGAGIGLGLENTFQTDPGSTVAVDFGTLAGETTQANVFNSFGTDTVNIAGPTTGQTQTNDINAYGTASDSVHAGPGTTLQFLNNASGVSTVQVGINSTVAAGGGGASLIEAGSGGPDNLGVDTSSGNVTLVGSTGSTDADTFTFMHAIAGEAAGGAKETVGNFTSSDSVVLQGYGSNPYSAATVSGAMGSTNTVLTLNDGSTITFQGVSNTSTVTSHITVK